MEVTERLQPVKDNAYTLFEEIKGKLSQLEQVVTTVEKCLKEFLIEQVIQEFLRRRLWRSSKSSQLELSSRPSK
jgi:hypothetical protein